MATKTYAVGTKSGARRLDNLTGPWVDIPLNLAPLGAPLSIILRDVMSDPNNSDKVFAVGGRKVNQGGTGIYVSDSSGSLWVQPGGDIADLSIKFGDLHEVWVVDSNTIYACGSEGRVYKSIDAGLTFDLTLTLPTISGNPDNDVTAYALHFIDANIGVVAVDAKVYKTIDGGDTWVVLNSGADLQLSSPCQGIHLSVDQITLVAILPRYIMTSVDSGATWSITRTFTQGSGVHLTWRNDLLLHVVGAGDTRVSSIDGGLTWTNISTSNGQDRRAAHLYDDDNGFINGDDDMYSTADAFANTAFSETPPYQIQAVWTQLDPPVDEPCGCPEGTTYDPAVELCIGFATQDALNTGITYGVATGDKNINYGQDGAHFYENIDSKPYSIRRQNNFSQPLFGEILDNNGNGILVNTVNIVSNNGWGNGSLSLNGRLNVAGIWTDLPYTGAPADHFPIARWIGFTACIETPVARVYYIGIGADNQVRIRVNGVEVVSLQGGSVRNFTRWHMFPITLPAGTNFIELEGKNNNNVAAFGAEIYDADYATLIAMTTESQINSTVLFSTADKIGGTFDQGQEIGWECPPGWDLNFCDGYPQCSQYLTAPFEPCNCYLVTNCEDPTEQVLLTTEFPLDLDRIYVFYGYPDKCWTVEVSTECPPNDTVTDVAQSWITCEDCVGVCYTLTDCEGVEPPRQVSNDLSEYMDPFGVGKIVNLTSCPDVCWQITANIGRCTGAEEEVTIVEDFETCEDCIGVEPIEPLLLNHRKVNPGYDTPGCPPEYVEKIKCRFAEALYQQVISIRYGIEFCCEIDARKYDIKNELLKLKMITDPDACLRVPEECCPPCNVVAIIILPCPEPDYVIGRITID